MLLYELYFSDDGTAQSSLNQIRALQLKTFIYN